MATPGPARPRAAPTPADALGGGGGVDDWNRIWSGPIRDARDGQRRLDRGANQPEIRQQLRQEFTQLLRDELDKAASATLAASGEQTKRWVEDYAQALETKRTEDNQAIRDAFNKLESQLFADVVSLKKDVDTVAWWTDAGLRRARQELVQLADYTQPANSSNSPQK